MIALPGNRDQFRIRLTGFPAGSNRPATFANLAFNRAPGVQRITLPLSQPKLRQVRAASDVVLSASQHYDGPDRNASFERTHVATSHLNSLLHPRPERPELAAGSLPPRPRRCAVAPSTDRSWSDLRRCDSRALLQGNDECAAAEGGLIGTNLAGAVFTGARVDGTYFGGASSVI
jgi:uncharacterized protein YjbI with pentapeptide repeats